MSETLTPVLGLAQQATGTNPNTWGDVLNTVIQRIETAITASTVIDLTAGPVTLTSDQALFATIFFTGALTADTLVTVPQLAKQWVMINATTGAKVVSVDVAGDPIANNGGAITLPANAVCIVVSDGVSAYGGNGRQDGTFAGGGGNANSNVATIDMAAATITNGVITLSDQDASCGTLLIKGALVANTAIVVPARKRAYDVLCKLTWIQPAPGSGGSMGLGTVSGGIATGSTYSAPVRANEPEAMQAFGVTLDANRNPTSQPFNGAIYIADTFDLLRSGSFQGSATYTANADGSKTATGTIYEGVNAPKGTYRITVNAQGVPTIRVTEDRSGAFVETNLTTGATTAQGPTNSAGPWNLPASAGTYVQTWGNALYNLIPSAVAQPGAPPPDPTPAPLLTIKTKDGLGVVLDKGTSRVVCDGVDVWGAGGDKVDGTRGQVAFGHVPIGGVVIGPGYFFQDDPRVQYLECVGQTLNASDYPVLFAYLGSLYGGSGTTTFKLPDYRNQFLRGYDGSTGSLGAFVADSIRAHTHVASMDDQGAHHHIITLENQPKQTLRIWQAMYNIDGNKGNGQNGENIFNYPFPGSTPTDIDVPQHVHNATETDAGSHHHNITIQNTGGVETAPMHAKAKIWMRVK